MEVLSSDFVLGLHTSLGDLSSVYQPFAWPLWFPSLQGAALQSTTRLTLWGFSRLQSLHVMEKVPLFLRVLARGALQL